MLHHGICWQIRKQGSGRQEEIPLRFIYIVVINLSILVPSNTLRSRILVLVKEPNWSWMDDENATSSTYEVPQRVYRHLLRTYPSNSIQLSTTVERLKGTLTKQQSKWRPFESFHKSSTALSATFSNIDLCLWVLHRQSTLLLKHAILTYDPWMDSGFTIMSRPTAKRTHFSEPSVALSAVTFALHDALHLMHGFIGLYSPCNQLYGPTPQTHFVKGQKPHNSAKATAKLSNFREPPVSLSRIDAAHWSAQPLIVNI